MQRVDHASGGVGDVADGVGVLDAENERPAVVAGEGPVEQRSAHGADVQVAGRGRREPYPHLLRRQVAQHPGIVATAHEAACADATGLVSDPMPSTSTVTSCPGCIGPTPSGVPVKITSPGSKVVKEET